MDANQNKKLHNEWIHINTALKGKVRLKIKRIFFLEWGL
jgi:hypothetical protein